MTSSWWAKKLNAPSMPPPPATSPPPPARIAPVPQHDQRTVRNVQVTGENFAETSALWEGGDATRTEISTCPNCGSDLYFSRANAGGVMGQSGSAAPTPRCYACGFSPGREMQGVPPT